jgi:hypothetical protein
MFLNIIINILYITEKQIYHKLHIISITSIDRLTFCNNESAKHNNKISIYELQNVQLDLL